MPARSRGSAALSAALLLAAALLHGCAQPAPPADPDPPASDGPAPTPPAAAADVFDASDAAVPDLVLQRIREASRAPSLSIEAPEHGATVRAPFVVVRGTTSPGASVESGGADVHVAPDGSWGFVLALEPGENVALIEAIDAAGDTERRTIVVRRPAETVVAEPPKTQPPTTHSAHALPAAPSAGSAADEAQMLALLNGARAEQGLAALVADARMAAVARAHSADMAARGYFAHTNPDGLNPFDRMRAAGISFGRAGENIAAYPTTGGAHAGLMASPEHRTNILEASYTRVGIGIHADGDSLYFTQLFAD